MISCRVETLPGMAIVSLINGRSFTLPTDTDRASFAVHCGTLIAPDDWDESPMTLPGFEDLDLTDIRQCPDVYADVAEA